MTNEVCEIKFEWATFCPISVVEVFHFLSFSLCVVVPILHELYENHDPMFGSAVQRFI